MYFALYLRFCVISWPVLIFRYEFQFWSLKLCLTHGLFMVVTEVRSSANELPATSLWETWPGFDLIWYLRLIPFMVGLLLNLALPIGEPFPHCR